MENEVAGEKAVCWMVVCLTAEALKASFNIRLSTIHSILIQSHDVSTLVPDFAPLFRPGLESSRVEKMLLMKNRKRWIQHILIFNDTIKQGDFLLPSPQLQR